MQNTELIFIGIICLILKESSAIWCYRCTSATPGCGEEFNWRGIGYLGDQCPEDNDICVKLIERRGARQQITRDCLSTLKSFRSDIPADKYEGCRSAAFDPHLANYVNHTIKEHDVKRNFYSDTTFCFCFLDHRCNSAQSTTLTRPTLFLVALFCIINLIFLHRTS